MLLIYVKSMLEIRTASFKDPLFVRSRVLPARGATFAPRSRVLRTFGDVPRVSVVQVILLSSLSISTSRSIALRVVLSFRTPMGVGSVPRVPRPASALAYVRKAS